MKIDIEQIEQTLSEETQLERDAVLKVIRRLKEAKAEEDAAKPAPVKPPKFEPLVLFIPGPCPEESVAYLVEYDGEIPHTEVLNRLYAAVREANLKAKKKNIFGEMAEVVESMPRKWLKGSGIKLRYKGPAIIKQIDPEIPGVEQARNEEDDGGLNEIESVVTEAGQFSNRVTISMHDNSASRDGRGAERTFNRLKSTSDSDEDPE